MGSIMWWIGVFALALFFELWHRVGIRRACSIIWEFAGEIGPRDAAVRRRRHLWRNFGIRDDEDDRPPFCLTDYRHDGPRHYCEADDGCPSELCPIEDDGFCRRSGCALHIRHYCEADDDTPVTWPIQHWSDRR